mmetsp:Transcript_7882/g.16124  ORF Transcript_7882/g.16124 Transcript_7882/m.16124 type:complete len:800 (+) Transcript_7882:123-2522(+)
MIKDENHTTLTRACPLSAINYVPTLYSLLDIRKEFLRVLKIHGDRLSAADVAMWLGMEEDDAISVGDALCVNQREEQISDREDEEDSICKVYSTVKKTYQYALVKSLRREIEERIKWYRGDTLEYAMTKQSSLLSDTIAQEMDLTSEDVMRLSHERIATSMVASINDHPYLEIQVLSSLSGVTSPTSLEKLFDKDLALVIPITRTLCQQGRLPGIVSSSSNNAVYTPNLFTHFQRNVIDSFFRTNGYITETKCVGAGLSRNRMECFVRESFPNAVLLSHSIIDSEVICQPLEVVIQTAILNDGYADLRSLIPLDVASNNDDVEQVINVCLVDSLKLQQDTATFHAFVKGTTLINTDIALFFSHEMSKKSVKMLDAEIERYSKQRAKEIIENKNGTGAVAGGKKGKPAVPTLESTAADVISLRDVANCIGNNYPNLFQSQQEYEEGSSCEASMSWNSDEVGRCDGPLIEFCRTVYSDVERKCTRAVRAEVASLNSTRHGVSVSDRAVGAAKQMDVQEEFETSFKDLCQLLQILAKTIENFSTRGLFTSAEISSMKRELLSGTGCCLARLLTEYCLYRNNVEGARALTFSHQDHNSTPAYLSALDFPSFSLQYNPAEGGKQKNPLQHLRESLPGSSGLNLVRMWNICSDGNDDDDGTKDADELLDQFISHLEDSCLTLVGIPFSVLDKKAEKKLLTSRRQGLIDCLEKSSQQDEILRTCVILIYQQTKSFMISGKTMTALVMNLFEQEKKIPTRVTEVLMDLKRDNDVSPELLHLVKQFGTAKNSKALAAISETSASLIQK